MSTRRRSAGRVLGNALLNIAAFGGLVCIVLVILSAVFHISLIMFKTGSMSPTIPAGSLAVVREIPASAIEVGDVVTVDRADRLPVTHRVTSVSGEGDARTITMQGDANDVPDPAPYTVTEVRRVMGSVPGLAHVVVWFSNPWVLGGLTLCASALVTWAFWPRDPRDPGDPGQERLARGRHSGGPAGAAGVAIAALAIGLIAIPADPAAASGAGDVGGDDPGAGEQVIAGERITLRSIGDRDAMSDLQPGVAVPWQVGVTVHADEPGTVGVALAADGDAELGLAVAVRACTVRWVGSGCPGAETDVRPRGTADVGAGFEPLLTMEGDGERWFLVSADIPRPAVGAVELTLRASGSGDDVSVGPGPMRRLPTTGAGPAWAPWLGVGAVLAGLGVAGAARLVRRRGTRGSA